MIKYFFKNWQFKVFMGKDSKPNLILRVTKYGGGTLHGFETKMDAPACNVSYPVF